MNYSKQTQSNPTRGEQAQRVEPACSELARPELACGELVEPVEGVEPILSASGGFIQTPRIGCVCLMPSESYVGPWSLFSSSIFLRYSFSRRVASRSKT